MSNASASAAPATVTSPTATPEMVKLWQSVKAKVGQLAVARDQMNVGSKKAATASGWSAKQLTAALLTLPDIDPRDASEITGFVFPKNAENRAQLDRVIEQNARETDHKKRISKPVLLAIQRSAEPITIEQAQAKVTEEKTRKAGGSQSQTQTQTKKPLTPKEQAEQVQNLIVAAMKAAVTYGYDRADFAAEIEIVDEKFSPFPKNEEDDENEPENEENENEENEDDSK